MIELNTRTKNLAGIGLLAALFIYIALDIACQKKTAILSDQIIDIEHSLWLQKKWKELRIMPPILIGQRLDNGEFMRVVVDPIADKYLL